MEERLLLGVDWRQWLTVRVSIGVSRVRKLWPRDEGAQSRQDDQIRIERNVKFQEKEGKEGF